MTITHCPIHQVRLVGPPMRGGTRRVDGEVMAFTFAGHCPRCEHDQRDEWRKGAL